VYAGGHYVVSRSTFSNNTGNGLNAVNSSIDACTANSNHGIGFDISSVAISACAANNNLGGGISADHACTVDACTASGNSVFGIRAAQECVIRNNAVRQSVGGQSPYAGILVTGSNNRVEGNNTINCNHGIRVDGAGNLIIANSSSNCTIGFAVTGAQTIGPVISASGTISSSNPWANFAY
jgi:hypothetical protein